MKMALSYSNPTQFSSNSPTMYPHFWRTNTSCHTHLSIVFTLLSWIKSASWSTKLPCKKWRQMKVWLLRWRIEGNKRHRVGAFSSSWGGRGWRAGATFWRREVFREAPRPRTSWETLQEEGGGLRRSYLTWSRQVFGPRLESLLLFVPCSPPIWSFEASVHRFTCFWLSQNYGSNEGDCRQFRSYDSPSLGLTRGLRFLVKEEPACLCDWSQEMASLWAFGWHIHCKA